ncbi:MAG: tripartite tricarboxylate transporter permease [Trueperaceae bacterium]|nr:tripartite tricarboxylate transporter permease [Trueperaceae bacterium]
MRWPSATGIFLADLLFADGCDLDFRLVADQGLISGLLGLLTSTIGFNLVYGTQRSPMAIFNLMGGVSYIPALIGLFAAAGGHRLLHAQIAPISVKAAEQSRVTWAEFKGSLVSILRGSFIGVIIGTIPGAGATAAAFLSYVGRAREPRNHQTFGKGNIEGVADG